MKQIRKGIILAGGNGTRLYPLTLSTSKQLIPIYDKPMIYYSLSTLMQADIRDILIITNPIYIDNFKNLLGDGSQFGINFSYTIQKNPEGIAQSFLIAENFINQKPVALILGDNLFYGSGLTNLLIKSSRQLSGATIFAHRVKDPNRYGVVEFSKDGLAKSIEEKPKIPKSKYAVTGLYFYDENVVDYAKSLIPSARGELEITCLNEIYMRQNRLKVEILDSGTTWFDAGTFDSLHESSSFIQTLQNRQELKIGCPEEIAFKKGWIDKNSLINQASMLSKSAYGNYLIKISEEIRENTF